MSLTLFLVRHAQANEKEADQKDIDRTLSNDGLRDATRMGKYLKEKGIIPSMIITSPAVRAKESADLLAEQCGYPTEKIHVNDDLYNAPVRVLLQIVNRCKDEWKSVLIVCHNPGITYLAEYITGDDIGSMPAGALLSVKFKLKSWGEVSSGNGSVIEGVFPESLKGE